MGYTTEFDGEFTITPPLAPEHRAYLQAFAHTRRMKRDTTETERRPDPIRLTAGLPVGADGGYFVGAGGLRGQEYKAPGIHDRNSPPTGQPDLWCQWEPNDDGSALRWDGSEKFYEYVDWLKYLVDHFLGPWGYSLDGLVTWQGEEADDSGVIYAWGRMVQGVPDQRVRIRPVWYV